MGYWMKEFPRVYQGNVSMLINDLSSGDLYMNRNSRIDMKEKCILLIAMVMPLFLGACTGKIDEDELQQIPFEAIDQKLEMTMKETEKTSEELSSPASEELNEELLTEEIEQGSSSVNNSQETAELPQTETTVENNTAESTQTMQTQLTQDIIEDLFVGEYNSFDMDEPSLEIQKNEDGTYWIQIGVFRLVSLDDGKGIADDDGIMFSATAPNGQILEGTITLEGETAIVTFTNAEWSTYSSENVYKYYKTSNIPNIYTF